MQKSVLRGSVVAAALTIILACSALPAVGAVATAPPPAGGTVDITGTEPVLPVTPKPSAELRREVESQLPRIGATAKTPASATTNAAAANTFARQVFDLMNARRRSAGAPALRWNQSITNVSQEWANHLHGATMDVNFNWNTIHRADAGGSRIPQGASPYGEIIAFNFSPTGIVNWWMNSPSHRAAMLDRRETDAGVGFVVPTSGPYRGWHLVVSNLAGYPYPAAKPSIAPKPKPASPFADLVGAQQFLKEMNWMASKRISTGYPGPHGTKTYRPFESVKRDAMAAFLYRLAGSPAFTPPKVSPFADVSTKQQFYKEIAWLSAKKISTGWKERNGTRTFKPHQSVNRDAMAAFMYRWAH